MAADAIKDLGKFLVDPDSNDIHWWRLIVGVSVFGLLLFAAWAIGLTGGGFARADEVDKVSRRQVEALLDETHRVLCMDGADAQLLARARELERDYLEVNDGRPYVVNCELLLKLKQ